MTSIKSELLQRENSGHENIMQILTMQQEDLYEKMHIMSVLRWSELLHQLIDNKDIASLGAQYVNTQCRTNTDNNSLDITCYIRDKLTISSDSCLMPR